MLVRNICVIDQKRKSRFEKKNVPAFNTCNIARRGGGSFALKVGVGVGGQDNRARNETGPSIILHFTRGVGEGIHFSICLQRSGLDEPSQSANYEV